MKKVQFETYFYETQINLSKKQVKYLIDKIEEKLRESKYHFKTNVLGFMTEWTSFVKEPLMQEILNLTIDDVKFDQPKHKYELYDAWGLKLEKGHQTKEHSHKEAELSGVLYLSDVNRLLEFPKLKIKVKPTVGKLVIFSGLLRHSAAINKEDTPKYAISFNTRVLTPWRAAGLIGNKYIKND